MTFKLTFQPDTEYYKEAYDELLTLTNKKLEPILAIVMTIFGIGLYYFDKKGALGTRQVERTL